MDPFLSAATEYKMNLERHENGVKLRLLLKRLAANGFRLQISSFLFFFFPFFLFPFETFLT